MLGYRMQNSLAISIIQKSLYVSLLSNKEYEGGTLVDLLATDTSKVEQAVVQLSQLMFIPLQLAIGISYMYFSIGNTMFIGLSVLVFMLWLNMLIVKYDNKKNFEIKQVKVKRIKVSNEVFGQIKYIKVNACEEYFYKKLNNIREEELNLIKKKRSISIFNAILFWLTPIVVVTSTFAWYTLTDNLLTAQTAFLVVSVFTMIREPMQQLPSSIQQLLACNLGLKNITAFLQMNEIDKEFITQTTPLKSDTVAIELINGSFNWGEDKQKKDQKQKQQQQQSDIELGNVPKQILHNIGLQIKKGSMVAFIGDVGAGKSSLLLSLLGEMKYNKANPPQLNIKGSLSLVNQKPWIISSTIKENILFGLHYDQKKYEECIKYSQLESDFKTLPKGESTEIGDKGVNLSGGQKTRIALARALYSEADILLLDDLLSAVDIHVGLAIVKECLKQYCSNKTRLLVTHALYYMKYMDYIYMLHDGAIVEEGDYQTMKSKPLFKRKFEMFMKDQFKSQEILRRSSISSKNQDSTDLETIADLSTLSDEEIEAYLIEQKKQDDLLKENEIAKKKEQQKLEEEKKKFIQQTDHNDQYTNFILQEDRQKGAIKLETFKNLLDKLGGYTFIIIFLIGQAVNSYLRGYSYVWMANWSEQGTLETNSYYLTVFSLISLSYGLGIAIVQYYQIVKAMGLSTTIHQEMIHCLLYAPLNEFFERIPIGRILNRLTSNVSEVDMEVNFAFNGFVSLAFQALTNLSLLIFATSIIVLIPILIFIYFCLKLSLFVQKANRELERLLQISKSPITNKFQENLNGLDSIRAYKQEIRMLNQSLDLFDETKKNQVSKSALEQFQRQSLSIVSMIIHTSALYIAFFSENISPGMLGVLLIYAFNLDGNIRLCLQIYATLENRVVSFERCQEYTKIECEQGYKPYMHKILEARARNDLVSVEERLTTWPHEGKISFNNVKVKYRKNLDNVLKGLNLSINSQEKIGVVGRTGAGKSTITLCLLRILELSEGVIKIDDEDISQINLFDLRQKITIILQDPQLFQGTIKDNVDPLNLYSDQIVQETLIKCNLGKYLSDKKDGVKTLLTDQGSNLSIGEKQLICIARALLKRSKVVLIDEATANIDVETEQIVQKTLSQVFDDCTVITIAHRVNTIMSCHKILVLNDGLVAEFDSPQNLMKDQNSLFYKIVEQTRKEGN